MAQHFMIDNLVFFADAGVGSKAHVFSERQGMGVVAVLIKLSPELVWEEQTKCGKRELNASYM